MPGTKRRNRRYTINITGVYSACTDCYAYLKFKNGDLVVDGAVVILPGTEDREFLVKVHRADCKTLEVLK